MAGKAPFSLVLLLTFFFFFTFTLSISKSESNPTAILPLPLPLQSLTSNYGQDDGNCSYKVVITTSCSSPRVTTDEISISFGDNTGNQIYVSSLEDPVSGTFARCSTDGFNINGPCGYQICYVYFYRSGKDGWQPSNVTISGDNSEPITFTFESPVPNEVWYGFDKCEHPPPPPPPPPAPSSSVRIPTRAWSMILVALAFVLIGVL